MKEQKRLQMMILSSVFFIPITLLALSRGLSKSIVFWNNLIIQRLIFITSGIMIIYYAKRLTIPEGNNDWRKRLLLIFERTRVIRSTYVFNRLRARVWKILDRWVSLIGSNQYMRLLPIKSILISSNNFNHRQISACRKYVPFSDEMSNIDETQAFSQISGETDERDLNSLYIEEDIDVSASFDVKINRCLPAPIKFYRADEKFSSNRNGDFNKLEIINMNIPLTHDNFQFENNKFKFSRKESIPSVTSLEFILTPTCSIDELRQCLSNENNNMISAINCVSDQSSRTSEFLKNSSGTIKNVHKMRNNKKVSTSSYGLRCQSSRLLSNSFFLISK